MQWARHHVFVALSFSVVCYLGRFSVCQTEGFIICLNDNITNGLAFVFDYLILSICFNLQPKTQHVVETQPNVHYLIDFDDGQEVDIDQVDRFDFSFHTIFSLKYASQYSNLSSDFPRLANWDFYCLRLLWQTLPFFFFLLHIRVLSYSLNANSELFVRTTFTRTQGLHFANKAKLRWKLDRLQRSEIHEFRFHYFCSVL